MYENEVAKAQAEAMKGESGRSIEDQVFTSSEGIKFPVPNQEM